MYEQIDIDEASREQIFYMGGLPLTQETLTAVLNTGEAEVREISAYSIRQRKGEARGETYNPKTYGDSVVDIIVHYRLPSYEALTAREYLNDAFNDAVDAEEAAKKQARQEQISAKVSEIERLQKEIEELSQ